MTLCRYRAATATPHPRGREAPVCGLGGADAPARRLRAALMSHHQGSMVSVSGLAGITARLDGLNRLILRVPMSLVNDTVANGYEGSH
jgi:hypothetical protein